MSLQRFGASLVVVLALACQQKSSESPAPPSAAPVKAASVTPAPPPPPPSTSLGTLDSVQRAGHATLHALCADGTPGFLGVVSGTPEGGGEPFTTADSQGKTVFRGKPGVEIFNTDLKQVGLELCERDGNAHAGKQYVILSFSGKRTRSVDADEMMKFVAHSASGTFARVEGKSWLQDAAGNKYRNAAVVARENASLLAFEVPADAASLTWHDGKDVYPLEVKQ